MKEDTAEQTTAALGSFSRFSKELYPLLASFMPRDTVGKFKRTCKTIRKRTELTPNVLLGYCMEEIELTPNEISRICLKYSHLLPNDYNPPQHNDNPLLQALTVLLFPHKFNKAKLDEAIEFAREASEKNPSLMPLYHSLEATQKARTGDQTSLDLYPVITIYLSLKNLTLVDCGLLLRLRGADLREARLDRSRLSVADLSETNLSGSFLPRACLFNANLRNANLSNANLTEAELIKTNFQKANFFEANLFRADLSEANFSETNLFRANLREVKQEWCSENAFGVNFTSADLRDARLDGANLYMTNLTEANIYKANFTGANLIGAKVTLEQITNAIFDDTARMDPELRERISSILRKP